jgi:hypothetical protein
MRSLNHSSAKDATTVQAVVATVLGVTSNYTERFREAVDLAKIDLGQLAHDVDLSYQAVKKVYDGTSKSFNAENNVKVARVLKVDSEWLATGAGQREPLPLSAQVIAALKALDPRSVGKLESELRIRFDLTAN